VRNERLHAEVCGRVHGFAIMALGCLEVQVLQISRHFTQHPQRTRVTCILTVVQSELGRAPGHLSRLLLVTASQISFTAVDQGQGMKGHEAGGFGVLCGLFGPGRGLLENCQREDRRTRTGPERRLPFEAHLTLRRRPQRVTA
jgi:hypothetical protein